MQASQVEALISAGIDSAEVSVRSDDDTHFEALVVAAAFDGMRTIQRHQLIYASLGELVGREIHALSIKAYSPGEWRELGDRKQ